MATKSKGFGVAIGPHEFHRGAYASMFAVWPRDGSWGEPPTESELEMMHVLCARAGSKHCVSNAMKVRKGGATTAQIWAATQAVKYTGGSMQTLNNYTYILCGKGGAPKYFTRVTVGPHTQLTITALGEKTLAQRLGRSDNVAASRAKALTEKAAAAAAAETAKAKAEKLARAKAKREANKAAKLAAAAAEVPQVDAPQVDAPSTDSAQ